jgi:CelD/BcsL family acetyltransferase involved in cellulose biosynthesis
VSAGGEPTVEALTSTQELQALAPEWSALVARSPLMTPFQDPKWLLGWCSAFQPRRLCVLTARSSGRLVAMLPLCVPEDGELQPLKWLGVGISDCLDAIADPPHAQAALVAMLGWLHRRETRVMLDALPPQSPLLGLELGPAWARHLFVQQVCPVLSLPRGATPSGVLPPKLAERIAYERRRAQKAGVVMIEADLSSLPRLLAGLVRLHTARWRSRGEAGVLADERICGFHQAVAPGLLATGALRLFGLEKGGELIGALYALIAPTEVLFYLAGFEPSARALSPGHLLVAHTIDQALAAGARALNFLRGPEPYKYAWGAVDRPSFGLTLTPHPGHAP